MLKKKQMSGLGRHSYILRLQMDELVSATSRCRFKEAANSANVEKKKRVLIKSLA